jgi:IclR family KDG regulon transcriptional repressor
METHTKPRKVIASVQHALQIMDLFDGTHSELGNAEIAKALNMDPGTVAGLVYTLKLNKYLDQNLTNRKYRLGLKLVERASLLLRHIDLRKIATPYLEELLKWSGESVNLGIRDQNEVVYIERLFGDHSLGIRSELGKRAPLHSTALGKVILAHMDQHEARNILTDYDFIPVTRFTITDQKQFLAEIERIRESGFAIDEQENEIGGRCIAAPIYNNDGNVVAAVSISVPIQRLPNEKIAAYGEKIKAAALEISRNFGYT